MVLSPYKPKDDDLRNQSTYRYLGLLLFLTWKSEAIWHGNERGYKLNFGCAGIENSCEMRYVNLQVVEMSLCAGNRTSESMFKCPLKSLYVVKLPTKGKYTQEKRIEDKPWKSLESEMMKG